MFRLPIAITQKNSNVKPGDINIRVKGNGHIPIAITQQVSNARPSNSEINAKGVGQNIYKQVF